MATPLNSVEVIVPLSPLPFFLLMDCPLLTSLPLAFFLLHREEKRLRKVVILS